MSKGKNPISQSEFNKLREVLLLRANPSIRELGFKLMDYCWPLDNYAVSQEWEGKKDRLLVFGLPKDKRARAHAKNYFSIWRTDSEDIDHLKCEIILPRGIQSKFLAENNFKDRMYPSTLRQVTGQFKLEDYECILSLIRKAYNFRAKNEFAI